MLEKRNSVQSGNSALAETSVLLLLDAQRRLLARYPAGEINHDLERLIQWEAGHLVALGPLSGDSLANACSDGLRSPEAEPLLLELDLGAPTHAVASLHGLMNESADQNTGFLLIQIRIGPPRQNPHRIDLADRYRLTYAEFRVLEALMQGLDPQAIADHYGIGLPTVRTHLQHLRKKLHCHKTSDLILRVLDP